MISDENGEPLPGVNVIEKGTNNGTVTNLEGRFSLEVSEGATLVFSSVGYITQEVNINNQSTIDLSLQPDIQQLQELVVIGYGTQKKSDLTGAVSSVKSDEIKNMVVHGVDQAIQGRVAGVSISSNTGEPGESTTIRIRGTSSIYSGNDPLFVVDGIPVTGSIDRVLNPNNVESIEVLKDASASAIYGSRGANGVILITTKKGKEGKPVMTFDSYYGFRKPWKDPEIATAEEFAAVHILAHENGDTEPDPFITSKSPAEWGVGTRWWDEIERTGIVQNYNFSISGGLNNLRYATSLGYFSDKGFIKKSEYDRVAFRTNVDYSFNDKLKIGTNIALSYHYKHDDRGGSGGKQWIANAMLTAPITPVYKTEEEILADGGDPSNPYDWFKGVYESDADNVASQVALSHQYNNEYVLLSNAFAELEVIKNLKIKSEIGIQLNKLDDYDFTPQYFISPDEYNDDPWVSRGYRTTNSWVWNNLATFNQSFNDHNFTLMGAITSEHWNYESLSGFKRGLPGNNEELRYLDAGTYGDISRGGADESSLLSYIGRLNYSFADRYLLTASIRADGSSKFAKENRWGYFPSFSVGWIISEEQFLKNLQSGWLDNLKLRLSWGEIGNQDIPSDAYITLLSGNYRDRYPFGLDEHLEQGYRPDNAGNPDVQWETVEQTNIGLDMAFFKGSWILNADYFIKNTKDNLLILPQPYYVGSPSPWTNVGEIQNRGLELATDYRGNLGDLSFNIGGNISFIKNEVKSLANAGPIPGGSANAGSFTRTEVGNPISEFYGYVVDGIFQNQEEVGEWYQPSAVPGDIKFKDLNNDEQINSDDQKYIGSPHPDFYYGFKAGLDYKNFDFSLFVQGQEGNNIFFDEKFHRWQGEGFYNVPKGLLNKAWHGEGTSNSQPRITSFSANNNFRVSTYYLEDGSYLRFKNVTLGYTLPQNLSNNLWLNGSRIYITAENLITLTDFQGMDPEFGMNYGQLALGYHKYTYPQARTFIAGIQLNF